MIKLFASDLDGTLLLPKFPSVDDKISACLDKVIEQECGFVVATGRNLTEIKTEEALWKRPLYFVAMNGALILDTDKSVIQKNCFSEQLLESIATAFGDTPFEYLGADAKWCSVSKQKIVENYQKNFHIDIENMDDMNALFNTILSRNVFDCSAEEIKKQEVYKIDYPSLDEAENQRVIEKLTALCGNQIHIAYDGQSIEITLKNVDKGNAIQTLCDYLQLDQDEVAVFGDSGNDVPMLEKFKHSYAVENAKENAKQAARYQIGNCCDYAVVDEIEKLIKQS